jgi:glutamate synthase domain-containing protein 1
MPNRMKPTRWNAISGPPEPEGLYDPQFEHDACGVGMICHIKGHPSHDIIRNALRILSNLAHRGACGCDATTGDGAGILIQMPHALRTAGARPVRGRAGISPSG